MKKVDFLKKNSFERTRNFLVQSFFPENLNFFSDMKCNHKFDVTNMIVKQERVCSLKDRLVVD